MTAIRQLDLVVLVLGLAVFLGADLPIVGWVTVAAVWQPGRSRINASIIPVSRPMSHRRLRENLPRNPAPSSARPDTGNHVAYAGIPEPLP